MSNRSEQLRSTRSYIWYTGHVLGTGATSNVYIGRHKKTGEKVAVKTFNSASFSRPHEVQVRELDVIRKLKHKNIVDLLAIEDDQITKQPVIIMELCMGGSLYSILEEPQNIFGLKEEEFLIVLRDVTSGIKYLRETNIVHRDLKPGNIMRVIAEDNTSIYKLADFGAARELQEGGEFMSLYGTEEYLHPDLYQRAVLKVANRGSYSAKIDLWSVGVTFYHAATGQLPFRPYGGRRNRETMNKMTSMKKRGVISGVQYGSPDGEIKWSSHLPETCHLSSHMKKEQELLLSMLLESDMQSMCSFDDFFTHVEKILSMKKVQVFSLVISQMINIYNHPESGWNTFATSIEKETGIPSDQQLLLFKDQILDAVSWNNPETSNEYPILLLRKDLKTFPSPILPAKAAFPEMKIGSLTDDYIYAKKCCGSMYYNLKVTENVHHMQWLMSLGVKCFCDILQYKFEGVKDMVEMLKTNQRFFDTSLKNYLSLIKKLMPHILDDFMVQKTAAALNKQLMLLKEEYDQEIASNSFRVVSEKFDDLYSRFTQAQRTANGDEQKCHPEEHCNDRFKLFVEGSTKISAQFLNDIRSPHYNERIHKSDKA